ncbi:DEAD-box ATP-dependent RNA helicase 42 [Acorus gramineus]|uniref:RNA helicase n=1 Tax=Acorus gramineus TaxID=55184 RepID=A0AAV9A4E1_ACOGR|nr:DEAD-box ATP-dependent RNA helicase 42 [Acorus gramineus]
MEEGKHKSRRGEEGERKEESKHHHRHEREKERHREKEKSSRGDRDRERDQRSRSERHKDDGDESSRRRKSEEGADVKVVKTSEEDAEEEQRKLDEEMEKRRRRVQEWQELKRKKEEEKLGGADSEEPKSGKNWTLEGESDDEEAKSDKEASPDGGLDKPGGDGGDDTMIVDSSLPVDGNEGGSKGNEEEVDPLDAFMNSMVLPEVEKLTSVDVTLESEGKNVQTSEKKNSKGFSNGNESKKGVKNAAMGRIIPGEDSDDEYGELDKDEDTLEDEDDDEFMKRVKKTKAEKLSIVDHSKIEYPPFRKNFYIEVKEISKMTSEEVVAYRKQLELKLHGKDIPKPIKTWNQTGLTSKILDVIKKMNYEKPMPIQAQALPIIMSGRDCIGIAKTGSGKTLAFVLPMLRHIKDQPMVVTGDGPIGLIMAPTRELVQQIHSDIKKFTKVMGINCVPVYGGSGVAQQISDLKRGTEIVVCTPGRMIDILCTSGGKISNLRRVTYMVMDEADRMFDMGFEPQITRIVQNTRPDRQTVLFSATFPRQVEALARKVLNKPVEIQVGGRSVVNKDITQLVEVRPESDRFWRLLELLGEWYEKGKILIFVHSQEKCDALFKDLLKHGYPCLSYHGAKDQTDRESTISDFKSNVCNLMIATSIAARGLDVKELELVVNFDAPNHYEDYVHRVGRTGRAGRKGCAITFISEEDARYAPDLVKALELSEQSVPDDLKALADGFMVKVNQGTEHAHGTGYGGSGFKFNEEEDEARKAAKKAQAREYGFEEDKSDSDSEDDGVRKAGGDISQAAALQAAAFAAAKAATSMPAAPVTAAQLLTNGTLPVGQIPGVMGMPNAGVIPGAALPNSDATARAAALVAAINLQHNLARIQADAIPEHYEAELEINDFPQNARWRVTHKETLGPISEWTGAAITTRGQYYPPGRICGPGERKLYLFFEGPTEISVRRAKVEVKRVLEDITAQSLSLPGAAQPGKYSVL